MKILQICSANSIGGGERHVADLANSLARRGHAVFVAVRPGSPLVSILDDIDPANLFRSEMRNAAGLISASRIAGFARRNHVEVIHAHMARDYPIAALAARLSGVPFVLTRHVLFPMKRLQKFVLHRVSAVIAPSTAVYDALAAEAIIPKERIMLIHNGVDISRFDSISRRRHDQFVVGTIGHLGKIKGHDIFIRAAAIAAKHSPGMRFVIIGDDKSRDAGNRRELNTLIAALKMSGNIELVDWATDITGPLSQMDIFVSAARSEPFGLAICEAMASSVPVIATASEGAREIIEDKVSGWIVHHDDPDRLASLILELAGDEAERMRLADNGRRRVHEQFSLESMVDNTEALYRHVVTITQRTGN